MSIRTKKLSLRQSGIFIFFSVVFFIVPTRSFVGITSDLIQIVSILGAATLGFMSLVISIDHTFGLKGIDPKKLADIITGYKNTLSETLLIFVMFLLSIVLIKMVCLWLLEINELIFGIICRILAMFVGGLFFITILQFGEIVNIFSFLITGVEISSALKAKSGNGEC